MRILILCVVMMLSLSVVAQEDRDTTLSRCPVFITDTVSSNNFFITAIPVNLKVYRSKGDLTIVFQQKDQFFSMFFGENKLKENTYKISSTPRGRNGLAAKYSFRSGEQVSYVNVVNGTVDVSYDKEKELWRLKVDGMIANLVESRVSYFRVKADFYIQ